MRTSNSFPVRAASHSSRRGSALLTVLWLMTVMPGALAGGPATTTEPPGLMASGRGDYSLFFAPSQPYSFLEMLTVSPIGEGRSSGLGRGAVSDPSPYYAAGMDLTDHDSFPDKSRSYLFSFENGDRGNRYVGLARLDRFDAGQTGRMPLDEYRAELMIGYSVPRSGSILFGKGVQMESPGNTSLKVLDDGWRFKFIKTF